LERAFIEQKVHPFTRGHLAGGVLLLDARLTAARFGFPPAFAKQIQFGKFLGFLL